MAAVHELVGAAIEGDTVAFGHLVTRYQDLAMAVAYARTGDVQIAREVTQEAFLEAWSCLPRLRSPHAFSSWLRRILVKRADRVTRRARPELVAADSLTDRGPSAEQVAEAALLRARVDAAIQALPEHERLTVSLFYLSDRPIQEIASFLGVKEGAVKKRLHTARQRLKEDLDMTARDLLHHDRPSQDDHLARTIRFFVAVRVGEVDTVRHLLEEDPTLVDATQPTHAAAAHHYMAVHREAGWTALHLAAMNGHLPVVAALLQAGADPDRASAAGHTALHVATGVSELEIVRALLIAGAGPSPRTQRSGTTPLHIAAIRGDEPMQAILTGAGADPDVRDTGGRTPDDWRTLPRAGAPDAGGLPWATGIKAIDLLAPLPATGLVHLRGAHGIGMIVLLGELMHRHQLLRGGTSAFVCLEDRAYGEAEFAPMVRELGTDATTQVYVASRDRGVETMQAALASGASLVVVDHALARVPGALDGSDALVVAFEGWEPRLDELPLAELPPVDAVIALTADLARQGLYPAVDAAGSRGIDLGTTHHETAAAARRALADGDAHLAAWLSQPFYVAESFNGMPGVTVAPATTLADARRVLAGAYADHAPADLRYRGALG